jgi:formylglycine-generating enzyme required for sulfatase activity
MSPTFTARVDRLLRSPRVTALRSRLQTFARRLDATPDWFGYGSGALLGLALAWGALGLGTGATLVLAAGLVLLALGLAARPRLAADGLPVRRTITPPLLPPLPAMTEPPDTKESAAAAPQPSVPDPFIALVTLPGGTYRMGSDPRLDPSAYDDEQPPRQVRVSPFAIARTPVTRGLWRQVMAQAADPWRRPVPDAWGAGDDTLPATGVDWFAAAAFCNALSIRSGRSPCYRVAGDTWICDWQADGYRLPTEAEWEYACRGGTATRWFWGDNESGADAHAWFSRNSEGRLHPVGEKTANPFGLHDLAGNCWEWCWDWSADRYDAAATDDPRGPEEGRLRAVRGGSFLDGPWGLRSARRDRNAPSDRDEGLGFRCVRSPPRSLVP